MEALLQCQGIDSEAVRVIRTEHHISVMKVGAFSRGRGVLNLLFNFLLRRIKTLFHHHLEPS